MISRKKKKEGRFVKEEKTKEKSSQFNFPCSLCKFHMSIFLAIPKKIELSLIIRITDELFVSLLMVW